MRAAIVVVPSFALALAWGCQPAVEKEPALTVEIAPEPSTGIEQSAEEDQQMPVRPTPLVLAQAAGCYSKVADAIESGLIDEATTLQEVCSSELVSSLKAAASVGDQSAVRAAQRLSSGVLDAYVDAINAAGADRDASAAATRAFVAELIELQYAVAEGE